METLSLVPVTVIDDPVWNSRVTSEDPETWKAFVATIKREGVQTPVQVRRKVAGVDSYVLVFGSRRLKASREAGHTTIKAIVLEPHAEMSGADARLQDMLSNARENMARKDLTPYEQAKAFSDMRDAGIKNLDISGAVGVTPGYASNLVVTFKGLDPRIVTKWAEGDPLCNINYLRQLVNEKDHAKQWASFQERVAQAKAAEEPADDDDTEDEEDEDDSEGGGTRNAPAEKYHVEKARYQRLRRALRGMTGGKLALDCLSYLVGATTEVKGVISDKVE